MTEPVALSVVPRTAPAKPRRINVKIVARLDEIPSVMAAIHDQLQADGADIVLSFTVLP